MTTMARMFANLFLVWVSVGGRASVGLSAVAVFPVFPVSVDGRALAGLFPVSDQV